MALAPLKKMVNRCLKPMGVSVLADWEVADAVRVNHRLRFFEQIARTGFAPAHVLDVGAHKGDWSRDMHRVFPDARFTLVEPQVEMKPYLDRFCEEVPAARWVMAGAGARAGEMAFTVGAALDSSSFAVTEEEARARGLERRVLPVVTVDDLVAGTAGPPPDVVKIDAEGLDLDVARGASSVLGRAELFFLEAPLFDFHGGPSFHDIVAFMRDHGYEPFDLTEFIRRPRDGALALVEVAFARRDGLLRDHHGW